MRGDFSPVNHPNKIRGNLETTIERMLDVDRSLGESPLIEFCNALSRLLYHIEPELDGINSHHDRHKGADLTTLIIGAATELETAWNALRMANIPAARRQGRVASEFIGVVALSCIPRDLLAKLSKKESPVSGVLSENPGKSVLDLYEPVPVDPSDSSKLKPAILSTHLFKSFLYVAKEIIGIDRDTVEAFRDYREFVQHPASHGSSDVSINHFLGFSLDAPKGGLFLSEERLKVIRSEANQLVNLARLLADILDAVAYDYLSMDGNA